MSESQHGKHVRATPHRRTAAPMPRMRGATTARHTQGVGQFQSAQQAEDALQLQRAQQLQSARSINSIRPKSSGRGKGSTSQAIIALVLMAVIIGGAGIMWMNRSVQVSVNGNPVSVKIGSSLSELIKKADVNVKAGNLVAVDGSIIEEGKGNAFSAKVGDSELDQNQIKGYKANEGDRVDFSDGSDISEDYDSSAEDIQPKLTMEGGYGALAYVKQWGYPGRSERRTGKQSGKTVDITVQEPQNCIIFLHNPKPDNDQKLVALTFDDGPSSYTQKYLDILAQHGAKATFFNMGQNVKSYPDLARKIVESGNQLASHTENHLELTTLDAASLQDEMNSTFTSLKDIAGVETTVFRPPYGAFKERSWLDSAGAASVSVLWNQDSLDWRVPGVDTIVSNSLKGIKPGSIILMHDGGGNRDQDVEALPKIIESLQSDGYTFVTINELMQSDSSIPEDLKTGNARPPQGSVWPSELGD